MEGAQLGRLVSGQIWAEIPASSIYKFVANLRFDHALRDLHLIQDSQ